jgi:hypothetical protein
VTTKSPLIIRMVRWSSPCPAPILFRLTVDRRRFGVLRLQLVRRAARTVARAEPPSRRSPQPHLAGVLKHRQLQSLAQAQAVAPLPQDAGQRRLARLKPEVMTAAIATRNAMIRSWRTSSADMTSNPEIAGSHWQGKDERKGAPASAAFTREEVPETMARRRR